MSSPAPGAPGLAPTWSSSDKDFVTTALGASRLWVTVGHGVLNEVYWPSTGEPRLRDVSFYLVGASGWVDLKRERRYDLSRPGDAIPLLTVKHAGDGPDGAYGLELEILPDRDRDCVLVRYEIEGAYRLVVIAAPHLDGDGTCARAWCSPDDDRDLFAEGRSGFASLCMASRDGFARASIGFVGTSDGWQNLNENGRLTFDHDVAEDGNVALTAELEGPEGVIALAISEEVIGARTLARSALAEGFDRLREQFLESWQLWARRFDPIDGKKSGDDRYRAAATLAATVLKVHEDTSYPGALVASLSVPWGSSTNNLGGYHLVWPRDTVLTAFAFIAVDLVAEAESILSHLVASQQPDGHWHQNYYPDGRPYWTGIQLDEAALPILLAAKLRELGLPEPHGLPRMVRRAAAFIARTGPSTPQDRWEENPGINPFTLGCCIAALVAAAPWLREDERAEALDVADDWNGRLEEWCAVSDSRWTRELGVPAHYVRLRPPTNSLGGSDTVLLRNRSGETIPTSDLVAFEFSYLVRLGLRAPDDPLIAQTIEVVEHVLSCDTPSGRVYRRYNEDGYGETADGGPFRDAGIGRLWPFLVAERGQLALGRGEDVMPYLDTMLACASAGGLLPEQVWDTDAIPERNLFPGRPSGSAMPLLWSHAEYLKLWAARRAGTPIERLGAVAARYGGTRPRAKAYRWRDGVPCSDVPIDADLLVQGTGPFTLHVGFDGWTDVRDVEAVRDPFGIWTALVATGDLADRKHIDFTRRDASGWEGVDHELPIRPAEPSEVSEE